MATILGTYDYIYGAGNLPNRQIQFVRTGGRADEIQAQVFVLNQNGSIGNRTSTIYGENIRVEMESTTSKASAYMIGRKLQPTALLSHLTIDQQDAIIDSFPHRQIEVRNNMGQAGGFEVVTKLKIIDPR